MRRGSLSQTTHITQTAAQSIRFSSSVPDGLSIIQLSQKGLAHWLKSDCQKDTLPEEGTKIDVTKFCADHQRGLLYRFQSWEDLEKERETKSKKPSLSSKEKRSLIYVQIIESYQILSMVSD